MTEIVADMGSLEKRIKKTASPEEAERAAIRVVSRRDWLVPELGLLAAPVWARGAPSRFGTDRSLPVSSLLITAPHHSLRLSL
jgi:hypothetical protein